MSGAPLAIRLVTLTGGMTLTGITDFLAEESITELISEAGDPVTR